MGGKKQYFQSDAGKSYPIQWFSDTSNTYDIFEKVLIWYFWKGGSQQWCGQSQRTGVVYQDLFWPSSSNTLDGRCQWLKLALEVDLYFIDSHRYFFWGSYYHKKWYFISQLSLTNNFILILLLVYSIILRPLGQAI